MWTIWQMVENGLLQMAKFRANELGIVKIEIFADSHPNRTGFYLVGLCRDDSGHLFSFGDRVECLLAGEKISRELQLPFENNL